VKSSDSPSSAGAGAAGADDAGRRASTFGGAAGFSGFFSGFLLKIEKTKANQRSEMTNGPSGPRSSFYHSTPSAANA
jgi:hypothetical protein